MIRPLVFLLAASASVAVFIVLYLFFVRTHDGQLVDQLAYDGAEFGRRSVAPFAQQLLDALPTVSGVIGVVLTIVVALVRRNWLGLLIAFGAAGAAAATTQLLKYVILSRPDFGVEGYAGNSFPSGHTTVAAASALAVFLVSSPRSRPTVAAWGTAFTVLAGVSTLANQWHRPSDVVAALLVVAFWGCAGGLALSLFGRQAAGAAPRRTGVVRWWIAVPFLLVSLVAFLITFQSASTANDSPNTVIAYVGGATAIIASGFTLALLATRTFSRLP
ncbi:phosphatase PAP2 family protein [Glaciibacter sp. 2TAF33]|uniref:phosphatase PAP2 family protein n=1 Tax=Glaciibacter sp. 2TAF33 TaxID=3233015 RepID=UPI003F928D37